MNSPPPPQKKISPFLNFSVIVHFPQIWFCYLKQVHHVKASKLVVSIKQVRPQKQLTNQNAGTKNGQRVGDNLNLDVSFR